MHLDMPVKIEANVVVWVYQGRYGLITIDDVSEICGIVEQLMAEEAGLA
ncbi:MAG: hypothetical protein WC357_06180 [Candidatus Omnitrophota bacterium]|jgi:hypothetical protein